MNENEDGSIRCIGRENVQCFIDCCAVGNIQLGDELAPGLFTALGKSPRNARGIWNPGDGPVLVINFRLGLEFTVKLGHPHGVDWLQRLFEHTWKI